MLNKADQKSDYFFNQLAFGVSIFALAAVASSTAQAQEVSNQMTWLDTIIVSANRTPTEASKVASSVTVIDRDELDKSRLTYIKDYLNRVPGINISNNGPPGSTTSLRMRGAGGQYVLVRIDGIDVSDPSNTQTQASLSNMLAGDVERVEILRGSQSALYGSSAIAGVIDITTRKATENGVHHTLSVEGGSYGTLGAKYGFSGATETTKANISVERRHTDGFSSADKSNGNREKDGYDNLTISATASTQLPNSIRLFSAMRYSHNKGNYDGFGFAGPQDEPAGSPRNRSTGDDIGGRVGADFDLLDGQLKNTISFQAYKTDRYYRETSKSDYHGDRQKLEYLGTYKINDMFSLSSGMDYGREGTKTSAFGSKLKKSTRNAGVFSQLSVEPFDGLTLTGAIRYDHHSVFNGHATYRLTSAWEIAEKTKLRATYATGFRSPSLFELYSSFGNVNLKPEKSRSFDVGIDQRLFDDRLLLSATWFLLNTDDLIQYSFITSTYAQAPGTTRRHGIELAGNFDATDWLSLNASYTRTSAKMENGTHLSYVPRDKVTLGATITPGEKTALNVTGNWVSGSFGNNSSFVMAELPEYFLLDATLTHKITDNLDFSLKGHNLLNQKYQTIWGYGTARASVYASLTLHY